MIRRDLAVCKMSTCVLAILMCLAVPVSAEELGEGIENGMGEFEGSVKTDIFQIVMPTDTEGVFNFILDPQGLINKTDGAAYKGKTFEKDSTVFFKRTNGEAEEDYSSKSDPVIITNKSSIPVDVFVEVCIEEASIEGITMSDDKEFIDDDTTSLYLAIEDGENEVPVGREGASIQTTIEAAPEEAYEYVYDDEQYIYKLKDNLEDVVFDEYSFRLTGAANTKGNWAELGGVSPKIIITWKVLEGERAKDDSGEIINIEENSAKSDEQGLSDDQGVLDIMADEVVSKGEEEDIEDNEISRESDTKKKE